MNLHKAVDEIKKILAFHRKECTFVASYYLSNSSVFKMDYQSKGTALNNSDAKGQFNMGVGIFF
ncbi:MAG: hypothetical protein H8E16_04015 [Flavobacteriales bacterium]|nr:hypothetical protein [Flavobacteriales bacterium]